MTIVAVPYQQLPADVLEGLMEDFISREGTDYGEVELSLEEKMGRLMDLLTSGKAGITFDDETESCTIALSHQIPNY